jgi:predicted MFS family arabinose efflux permease
VITRYVGWEYIFYLNVPIGALALALAPRILPRGASTATNRRFDLPGALLGTGGLVLVVDAISQAPQYGWGSPRTVGLAAAAVALLGAFLYVENRSEAPILPLSIFRRRTLTGAITAGLLVGGSFFAFLFIGTMYMQHVLHYTALQTGLAWMSGSVPSVLMAGISQRLVTRRGPGFVLMIGPTMIATAIIWTTQAPVHGHFLTNLVGPFALVGSGTAFAFIPISIAALTGVQQHESGLASGLMNTSIQLGTALGIAIASSVAAGVTRATAHGIPALGAITTGYHDAMWVLSVIVLLTLPVTYALIRRPSRREATSGIETQETPPAVAAAN